MKTTCFNLVARAPLSVWAALLMVLGGNSSMQAAGSNAPPAPAFNVEAATRAYLDRMPPDQKARSDAYFEGGYWLQLWQFLYGAGLAVVLLQTGLSVRMRNIASRLIRFKPLQTA